MCVGCQNRTRLLSEQSKRTEELADYIRRLAALEGGETLPALADMAHALAVEFSGPAPRKRDERQPAMTL